MYYEDKIGSLRDLFGVQDVTVMPDGLHVGDTVYPIVRDVIILLPAERRTPFVRRQLAEEKSAATEPTEDIQYSFGAEWTAYPEVLPEHRRELDQYFDLVAPGELKDARVCDLGCGSGRWSALMQQTCRELVLVDLSDAIFAARHNLQAARHALFFMGDLRALPFKDDCCDFLFSLGVLHHLPTACLDEVRRLRRLAPRLLIFVYYALDNRPAYFRLLLRAVTPVRKALSRIRHPGFRKIWSLLGALLVYTPLVSLGRLLQFIRLGSYVPLYEFYGDKSLRRIEQDVYDRFFTSIEQRVTREEIFRLRDSFSDVRISAQQPYWHFVCVR